MYKRAAENSFFRFAVRFFAGLFALRFFAAPPPIRA